MNLGSMQQDDLHGLSPNTPFGSEPAVKASVNHLRRRTLATTKKYKSMSAAMNFKAMKKFDSREILRKLDKGKAQEDAIKFDPFADKEDLNCKGQPTPQLQFEAME